MTPIKARVKRIARHNEDYEANQMDNEFTPVSFMEFPQINKPFIVGFNKPDKGWWRTTEVKDMFWNKGSINIITKNSVYRILPGWEE